MVFRCQYRVLKSGLLRHFCPFPCVKQIRVKVVEVFLISLCTDLLQSHDPFVPCSHGKQPEMDEQSETVMDKPVRIPVIFRPLINVFTFHPLYSPFDFVCYA